MVEEELDDLKYYYSFDILRVILVVFLFIVNFEPPIPGGDFVTLPMNFAPGCLFAIYGYLVLRSDVDYRARFKKLLKVFLITFAAYSALSMVYIGILSAAYHTPIAEVLRPVFTKRKAFEFLVLNVWPLQFGTNIWMLQSALYALAILWVLDKKLNLMRYQVQICVGLFVFSFLVSEGAALWNFHFLGYVYIPGNFLTRALPYMLMGKIIHHYRSNLVEIPKVDLWLMFIGGMLLCYCEVFSLSAINRLIYINHLAGYILMTFTAVLLCLHSKFLIAEHANRIYKIGFYAYNPVGMLYTLIIAILATRA